MDRHLGGRALEYRITPPPDSRTPKTMTIPFSDFASSIRVETAFSVLAVAKRLKAQGKDVIELEIGDG